jgi:hypothetical protein
MSDEGSSYISTGNVSGTGIAVGPHAQASVTITQETKAELAQLLDELRTEIQNAQLPDGAKNVLLTKAVPEMHEALQSDDPKSGFQRGLERIDDQLQGVGAVTDHVSGILETIKKIAKTVGLGLSVAAPYIAALI